MHIHRIRFLCGRSRFGGCGLHVEIANESLDMHCGITAVRVRAGRSREMPVPCTPRDCAPSVHEERFRISLFRSRVTERLDRSPGLNTLRSRLNCVRTTTATAARSRALYAAARVIITFCPVRTECNF